MELSLRSRVGYATIGRIEQGNSKSFPTRRIMQKIATAFGKTYDPESLTFTNGLPLQLPEFGPISDVRLRPAAKKRKRRRKGQE